MKKGSRFYLLAFRVIILIIFLAASTYKLEPVYAQETPISTSTPTLRQTTTDEQAIRNLNKGLLPKEAIKTEPSVKPNLWESITQTFKNFLSPLQFFAESESIHQAYLPNELRPEYKETETKNSPALEVPVLGITASSPLEALTNLLGGSTGFYGAILPKEVQGQDIKSSEEAFEKSHFPEGINPITGQ